MDSELEEKIHFICSFRYIFFFFLLFLCFCFVAVVLFYYCSDSSFLFKSTSPSVSMLVPTAL